MICLYSLCLYTESLGLLSTANKFQSQKVRKDYEDLMTSRNKRFLDNTLANNEEVSKKVSIEYSFECLHS